MKMYLKKYAFIKKMTIVSFVMTASIEYLIADIHAMENDWKSHKNQTPSEGEECSFENPESTESSEENSFETFKEFVAGFVKINPYEQPNISLTQLKQEYVFSIQPFIEENPQCVAFSDLYYLMSSHQRDNRFYGLIAQIVQDVLWFKDQKNCMFNDLDLMVLHRFTPNSLSRKTQWSIVKNFLEQKYPYLSNNDAWWLEQVKKRDSESIAFLVNTYDQHHCFKINPSPLFFKQALNNVKTINFTDFDDLKHAGDFFKNILFFLKKQHLDKIENDLLDFINHFINKEKNEFEVEFLERLLITCSHEKPDIFDKNKDLFIKALKNESTNLLENLSPEWINIEDPECMDFIFSTKDIWSLYKKTKDPKFLQVLFAEGRNLTLDDSICEALWAHPITKDQFLSVIFDLYQEHLLELPPRNLLSTAKAHEIHMALLQYMKSICSYVESQISGINFDKNDFEIYEEFREKIKKSPCNTAFNACVQAIKANDIANPGMYTPLELSQDLVKIAKFLKILTKDMSEEKARELFDSYLSASFAEAADAYDGQNGVSCVKGVIERIYSGLKVVSPIVADLLKELEGIRLFKEWFTHPKNPLTLVEGQKFASFTEMMRVLNGKVLKIAEIECGLKLKKPYAINAAFKDLDSFLPLKKEIKERLTSEDYKNFLQAEFLKNDRNIRARSKSIA